MNADTPSAELTRLATLVRRMRPDWRDAEGFYEIRSEVAGALAALGRRLGAPAPTRVALNVTPPKPRLLNGYGRTCPACGKPFFTPNPRRLTCSDACRMRASRERLRARAGGGATGAPAT
jgi:hypothetical protein